MTSDFARSYKGEHVPLELPATGWRELEQARRDRDKLLAAREDERARLQRLREKLAQADRDHEVSYAAALRAGKPESTNRQAVKVGAEIEACERKLAGARARARRVNR